MLAVSRDRQFFVGLDVGAIELARALRDKEVSRRGLAGGSVPVQR
jgi:hypothetical protein